MGCQWYLAMTGAEMMGYTGMEKAAWLACHFSPYSTGLSNLPQSLPPDSLVILDDSTPLSDHDPERIAAQLAGLENIGGLLLDLQRTSPGYPALIDAITKAMSCPVAVTEPHAGQAACGVFLSPPLNMPLAEAVKPWTGREIWLDVPFGAQTITVTKTGCEVSDIHPPDNWEFPHREDALHCRYQIKTTEDQVQFTLYRSPNDLEPILQQASSLGITKAISLYQEYRNNRLISA